MLHILTVTQLNTYVKSVIEDNALLQSVFIKGEISNFTHHTQSGHLYFSLKEGQASVRAVMFQTHSKNLRFEPKNGLQVIVQCSIGVYEKEGVYQLYVYDLQPDGIGGMNLAYEQRKEKLEKEGLFLPQYKKPIPDMPTTIGVITSPTGAVIHDITTTLQRRYPIAKVLLFPVTVQGESASQEVSQGIAYFNQANCCDVIIIARGGGCAQDLAPFNDEGLVREIFASKIPIICAVGHETDYTLCDFVSDIRAGTPSIAAELVAPNIFEKQKQMQDTVSYLHMKLLEKNIEYRASLLSIHTRIVSNQQTYYLNKNKQKLQNLYHFIYEGMEQRILQYKNKIKTLLYKIDASNPFEILKKGYTITTHENNKLYDINSLKIGDTIVTQTQRACIVSTICEIIEQT